MLSLASNSYTYSNGSSSSPTFLWLARQLVFPTNWLAEINSDKVLTASSALNPHRNLRSCTEYTEFQRTWTTNKDQWNIFLEVESRL